MRRMREVEEWSEPRQARFKNIASPPGDAAGRRRNEVTAADDSAPAVRSGIKGPAAVASLPGSQTSAENAHGDVGGVRQSTVRENLEALAAATPEMRSLVGSEPPVRQVWRAGDEAQVSVRNGEGNTAPAVSSHSGTSWDVVIPEALRERRFAIALRPIEKLACGSKLYEATPRLLDEAGGEIDAGDFYGPARHLGLLKHIERRLAGYAFLAQLRLQHAGESSWMLVPLSAGALDNQDLPTFLRTLASRPGARLVMDSLVIEFEERDIAGRMQDMKKLSSELGKAGCNVGIRGFTAARPAEQLLDALRFVTVRLAPELVDRLPADAGLRNSLRAISDSCAKSGTLVIAPGAPSADTMVMLYELGVRAVEGQMTSPPRLFQPRRTTRLH